MGGCKIGSESDRRAEFGDRLFQIPSRVLGNAKANVGVDRVGFEADCPVELDGRLLHFSLFSQGGAKVIVGLAVIGIEPNRGAVFGDGLLQFPWSITAIARLTVDPASSTSEPLAARLALCRPPTRLPC